MNFFEALLSETRKAKSQRRLDLANTDNEMLGVGNCDPRTEQPSWRNEVWHCQRESQNGTLGHFDKTQKFRVRARGYERYNSQR
jgi:hypothetical protein